MAPFCAFFMSSEILTTVGCDHTHERHAFKNVHYVQKDDMKKIKALTGRDVEVGERICARFFTRLRHSVNNMSATAAVHLCSSTRVRHNRVLPHTCLLLSWLTCVCLRYFTRSLDIKCIY